jgi:NAD-dependent deacetylase
MHQPVCKRVRAGESLQEAVELYAEARRPVALTGAGISVESGIPDFRSLGGLWSVFRPDEYATINVFLSDPAKAWLLYRALGETLMDKSPGSAHVALAELEKAGKLQGVITQNIDSLHSKAGSVEVVEVHGEHQHLECLGCGFSRPFIREDLNQGPIPSCPDCCYPLKPNIVLFGEEVREMQRSEQLLEACDLLLVIGTSAQVFPVGSFPSLVRRRGGLIFEFNTSETALTHSADIFFEGKAGTTVPALVQEILRDGTADSVGRARSSG